MGWTHAVLTIVAVVGGSSLAAEWVLQGIVYFDGSVSYDDLSSLYVLVYVVLLVPPPVVIGVVFGADVYLVSRPVLVADCRDL